MDAVNSSIFFFYHLGMDLSKAMMNYLDSNQEVALTEYLNLQNATDGSIPYLDSLEEILQSLNISQN